MIDFKEPPSDGRSFEQLVREIMLIQDLHPQWTGQGQDQGRDIIATETLNGQIAQAQRRWLVQCKHFAHAGRSVGRDDIGSVIDDCRQISAGGYLLACSTQPSAGLMTKLKEISEKPENGLVTAVWDSVDFEKKLQEPRFFGLGQIFFPKTFATTPWKLYNRGSPNIWTAQFKGYFLQLNSRIAGSHPRLDDCERIIEKLESIHPIQEHEYIRPRAIYFNDKSGDYLVFVDYLVPRGKEPSLAPREFYDVLGNGIDISVDGISGMRFVGWDVVLQRIFPSSDHFDRDHYDFYNPHDGAFRIGIPRGETIEDICHYGNSWPNN